MVELGFDVPLPGSMNQPWHRDFPSPDDTLAGRRLNSLAFNLTTVDVSEDMGPFEIAPGTQWDEPVGYKDEMFPPESIYGRYEECRQYKMPKMGDISARTALCIHRVRPTALTRLGRCWCSVWMHRAAATRSATTCRSRGVTARPCRSSCSTT